MRSIKLALIACLLGCRITAGNPQPTINPEPPGGMVYVIVMRTMARQSPAVFAVSPDGERERVGCIWSVPFIGTWACRTMLAREGFAFAVDNHGQGEVRSDAVEVHELHFAGHQRRLFSDGSTFRVR